MLKTNQTIELDDAEINPYSGEDGSTVYDSVTVICKTVPPDFKEKIVYSFDLEGENVDTGKPHVESFRNFKLIAKEDKKLTFFHPDYCYNLKLEMSASKKEKVNV